MSTKFDPIKCKRHFFCSGRIFWKHKNLLFIPDFIFSQKHNRKEKKKKKKKKRKMENGEYEATGGWTQRASLSLKTCGWNLSIKCKLTILILIWRKMKEEIVFEWIGAVRRTKITSTLWKPIVPKLKWNTIKYLIKHEIFFLCIMGSLDSSLL